MKNFIIKISIILLAICLFLFSKTDISAQLVYYCPDKWYPATNNNMKCCNAPNLLILSDNTCATDDKNDASTIHYGIAIDALSGFNPPAGSTIINPNLANKKLTTGDICSGYILATFGPKYPVSGSTQFTQMNLEIKSCVDCLGGDSTKVPTTNTSFTSLGCIYTNISNKSGEPSLTISIFRIFYGLGLLLALFKGMMAGIKLMNSGNPDSIKEAREELIAIATAFLVASGGLIGLSYIGVDVLGLGPYLSNLPKIV